MNKRKYKGTTKPKTGDYVSSFVGGEMHEAWIVKEVLFDASVLSVEVLSLSDRGGAVPTGMTGFISPDSVFLMMRSEVDHGS